MINKALEDIDAHDIQKLVTDGVREDRTLEYKRELPGLADNDVIEFLRDVSSFANAAGGDIIYGVSDRDDETSKNTGMAKKVVGLQGINLDTEVSRLENLLRDGIAPRIPSTRFKIVDETASASVLVLRIPRSWNAPHMIARNKNSSRFYSRSSNGKYPLDVEQIRAAFLASEGQADRIRRFREERLGRIAADETPIHMDSSPRLVIHIFPAAALASGFATELEPRTLTGSLGPIGVSSWSSRFNFDGLLLFAGTLHEAASYVQLFRNGAIESVAGVTMSSDSSAPILASGCESAAIETLGKALHFYQSRQLEPPFFAALSVTGARGRALFSEGNSLFRQPLTIDRDVLLLPDIAIASFTERPATALRSVFDVLWQAGGFPGSPNYNEHGEWRIRA